MSYKDEQEMYRRKSRPRIVPEDEWDEHDRLFMSKGKMFNRRHLRRKFRDHDFTRKKGFKGHAKNKHQVPDFVEGTNHERHLMRRKLREETQDA